MGTEIENKAVVAEPTLEKTEQAVTEAVVEKTEEEASKTVVKKTEEEKTEEEVEQPTLETDEDELCKMRAKLYRFAKEADPPQWKERGTGNVVILKHKESGMVRLLMRRERTLKICANHYLSVLMTLEPHGGSDRALVWTAPADFADEEAKEEFLAIRFINADVANQFKEKFEEGQAIMERLRVDRVTNTLNNLSEQVSSMDLKKENAEETKEEKHEEGDKEETKTSESSTTPVGQNDETAEK